MKYKVRLTDEAKQNVRAIVAWYAERSQVAADRWYNGFVELLDSLAEDPHRHPLALENPRFPIELRQLNYGSGRRITHRIIFAIRQTIVVVYSVRHAAQDEWRPEHPANPQFQE
ncbi:MAG: type II toxin-antitoxin system RelE/ParE family toxin [Candidatus Binatia bacterium]